MEELGAVRLLHGTLGGQPMVVSADAGAEVPADGARISVAAEDLHLFHPDTGVRL